MKTELNVFKPCSQVLINGEAALVIQVAISAQLHVTYQLCWWKGQERVTQWVEEFEISELSTMEVHKLKIGFHE